VSPRPRKASDDDVLQAALRVMSRVGPAELTLGEIAREAGVTAGALVQRYGGKRELLRALSARAAEGTGDVLEELRRRSRTPLGTLRAWARCHAGLAPSPEALSRSLAYLELDLIDPELHASLLKQARENRRALVRLVGEAIAAGELPADVDPEALARALEVTFDGSLMAWAIWREGTAERWILKDLETLLALAKRGGSRRRRRR
jgi:AcrR family transcriptional regulator